jgi:hypothetical protein
MAFTTYTTEWNSKIHILKSKTGDISVTLAGSKIKESDYTDATRDEVKAMEDQETSSHYLAHMGPEVVIEVTVPPTEPKIKS